MIGRAVDPARPIMPALCVDEKSQIRARRVTALRCRCSCGPNRAPHAYLSSRDSGGTTFAIVCGARRAEWVRSIRTHLPPPSVRLTFTEVPRCNRVMVRAARTWASVLILDNYSTHKTPLITPRGCAKRPTLPSGHFTPTYSSWLNGLVER